MKMSANHDGGDNDQNHAEVYIFLDVDGVLNDKWLGHTDGLFPEDNESLHPHLISNLGELIRRLEIEQGLEPILVLSTTWRLQEQLHDILLSSFAKVEVGNNKTIQEYLFRFFDGDRKLWSTSDLNFGTTPEGRAAEIQAWLSDHCQQNDLKRIDLLVMILDDLDLLYTDTGKRNEAIHDHQFVCTVECTGHLKVLGPVGLTQDRLELSLQKVKQQSEMRTRRLYGTGRWTKSEWALLSANTTLQPHMQALRSDQCPSWIIEIAQSYFKEEHNGKNEAKRCWCWPCC